MSTIQAKPRAQELLRTITPDSYREAYSKGMSLSAWLESQDPSKEYNDGLDAFSRMLYLSDIKTASVPEAGIMADEFSKFEQNVHTKSLVPEFMARVWRNSRDASLARRRRDIYMSQDFGVNTYARPYSDSNDVRWDEPLEPAIPLRELIANEVQINSDAYRAFYLESDTDQMHLARVAEGTELPGMKLTAGEKTINLRKYGRKLEVTYEALRRMRIDRIARHLQRMAVQTEVDRVASALNVLINGDGNTNAAETFDLTDLDPDATVGTMTLKAWLAYKMKFKNPYMLTTILAQDDVALQLQLLDTGSANIPLVMIQGNLGVGSITPINNGLRDGVRMGWLDDAPAGKIVGFDRRMALEHIVEIGSNISEVDKYVTRQVEYLTMSEVEGWAIYDKNTVKVLDLNA